LLGATHKIELWCGLLDVRYAPIATKFCIAAKRREWDGPAVLPPRATDRIGSGVLKHEEHIP